MTCCKTFNNQSKTHEYYLYFGDYHIIELNEKKWTINKIKHGKKIVDNRQI